MSNITHASLKHFLNVFFVKVNQPVSQDISSIIHKRNNWATHNTLLRIMRASLISFAKMSFIIPNYEISTHN